MSSAAPGPDVVSLSVIALLLSVFWTIQSTDYQHPQAAILVLFILGLVLTPFVLQKRAWATWATLYYVVTIGVVNRAGDHAFNGSDVIGTTREAIALVAHGGNPYNHVFQYSNPRGAPFPYFPGEIAFYAIPHFLVGQIVGADKWAGVGIVVLLGCLAFAIGPAPAAISTAIYATFEPAVLRSLDGSNDTGLAFLVVLAVALLALYERTRLDSWLYASAIVIGWALAFKEFSWPVYPFLIVHLQKQSAKWLGYAAVSMGVALLFTLPFLVTAPAGFVGNIVRGLTYHQTPFGLDIWAAAQSAGWSLPLQGLAPLVVLASVAVVTVVLLRHPACELGVALLQGLAVLFVALLGARYATSSYFAFTCAVACAALALYLGRSTLQRTPKSLLRDSANTSMEEMVTHAGDPSNRRPPSTGGISSPM